MEEERKRKDGEDVKIAKKKRNRCNPVSGYSVAPGYGWSERKNCKLLLLPPGFHSDRDAGQVKREGEMKEEREFDYGYDQK